jgi:LCP family protein required for cell wall assembly
LPGRSRERFVRKVAWVKRLPKRLVQVALITLAGVAAVAAGFFFLRAPIRQQIARHMAQSAFGQDQLNVLLLGYQSDEGTTDTMMLVHLDVDRRTATLVSIPRDSWVNVPGQGYEKINSAYATGGAQMSAKVVSALLGGVPIDATVALQPEDAAAIVDAMGGINVDVDETMNYDDNAGGLHIHLVKGPQHLTGAQVAGYMRFRDDARSDYGRMHRQRQVIKDMLDQLSEPQNWAKLTHVMQVAQKVVKATLSSQKLAALVEVYRNVPNDNIRSFTLPSRPGWAGDASVVFVDPRWAKLIGDILFKKTNPPQDPVIVANATGDVYFDKTIIGTLRGAGWNVPTFIDQRPRSTSFVTGATLASQRLSQLFLIPQQPGAKPTLVIGSDLQPYAGIE